jgi:hypothetical protein
MNTSAGLEKVGGGRKSRRCVAAGEEEGDLDDDWKASC